jgi:D-xylose transport system substrate-binding protein
LRKWLQLLLSWHILSEKPVNVKKLFRPVSNGAKLVPAIFHEGMVVNRENLKLTVISEGYQTEEEVFK